MARRGEKNCSGRERYIYDRGVVVAERGERVRVGSLCLDSEE